VTGARRPPSSAWSGIAACCYRQGKTPTEQGGDRTFDPPRRDKSSGRFRRRNCRTSLEGFKSGGEDESPRQALIAAAISETGRQNRRVGLLPVAWVRFHPPPRRERRREEGRLRSRRSKTILSATQSFSCLWFSTALSRRRGGEPPKLAEQVVGRHRACKVVLGLETPASCLGDAISRERRHAVAAGLLGKLAQPERESIEVRFWSIARAPGELLLAARVNPCRIGRTPSDRRARAHACRRQASPDERARGPSGVQTRDSNGITMRDATEADLSQTSWAPRRECITNPP
jgi:hypothetical protein